MREKCNGNKCMTCQYSMLLTNECTVWEWDEVEEGTKVGGDDCQAYYKASINTYAYRPLDYIKEYEEVYYNDLLIENGLEDYLIELGKRAMETLDNLMDEELKKNPSPYDKSDTLNNAAYNKNARDRMEEIVLSEMILKIK